MRRTPLVLAAALAVSVSGASLASAEVTDTVVATTTGGLLTLTGTGASVNVSTAPGSWSTAVGATVLTVTDLTGTNNGWTVTATYGAPTSGTAIGGDNIKVSAANVSSDLTGLDLKPAVDQLLSSPVAMATTGTAAGTGVTEFVGSYKVRIPATAQVGDAFSGKVTYTVAAIRP